MPGASGWVLPTVRTTLPFVSAPAPVGVVLHGFAAGSSSVPYVQSSPGSLVSPTFVTSLSPVCGCDVLTTPTPHATWSTRPQSPPRRGTLNVGTTNPGVSQQVLRTHGATGGSGGAPQPGMPTQAAPGFPHVMHAGCSQLGAGVAELTVNVVLMFVGNGKANPSAVTHGVCTQLPDAPPQPAALLHGAKGLAEFVTQSFGPGMPIIWSVFGMGWLATIGSHV